MIDYPLILQPAYRHHNLTFQGLSNWHSFFFWWNGRRAIPKFWRR